VKLYMVELTVSELSAGVAWYCGAVGLSLTLLDEAKGFALLEGDAGSLSLKRGAPRPGGCRLMYEVPDLDAELTRLEAVGVRVASPVKASAEGYRRALLHDPDGNEVAMFEWVGAHP